MAAASRMNRQWRPLPESLDPEVAYVVTRLRRLKDRSGMSLSQLEKETAYSKSSWERYLNGRALPPRQAVEALGRLCDADLARLRALWERAEERWSRRAGEAQPPATKPEQGSDAPVVRTRPAVWWAVVLALCAAIGIVLAVLARTPPAPPALEPIPVVAGCVGAQCAGQEPDSMACDTDARSYADMRLGNAYVELRISDQCGAAWARISNSAAGDRVRVQDRQYRQQETTISDAGDTGKYVPTRMIAAGDHSQVRACVQTSNGEQQCTPWGGSNPVPPPRHR